MQQFSPAQMEQIRHRLSAFPDVIETLVTENRVVLASPVKVPETGIATWNHYYFCPDHAVKLDWQFDSPQEHRCPVDGHLFRGEPFDGAWWRGLNGLNAKACQELGLLWQLTGNRQFFDKVKALLLTYAKYYPDYQEHGGIPYNGPGKANAQTLCEANCHLQFTLGYDFIRDTLTADERATIETRLLREGAEFLMRHRHNQLHNHEVKISTTLGVIGAVIGEPRYLDFAVNTPYGLRYQLEHALLPGGLWFEGSLHYHFYALQGFMAFEKLARNTPYSLLGEPYYAQMLSLPLSLLMPDGTTPRLNDCIMGQEILSQSDLYEFAFNEYHHPDYADALHLIYQRQPRNNLDALLYGAATLPPAREALPPVQSFHHAGMGLTIMRDPASQRALLIKHTPYGGEHDHYDRLGILLFEERNEVFPDLGTTGYGVELHEGYYKQSATHNTICVNQANQPPARPEVLQWCATPHMQYLDVRTRWSSPAEELDSFTQVKWDSVAYRDILYRRRLMLAGDLIFDLTQVSNPHQQQVDWTLHIAGEALNPLPSSPTPFLSGPLQRMSSISTQRLSGLLCQSFSTKTGTLPVYLYGQGDVFQGTAPGNPVSQQLSYLIARSHQPEIIALAVYDLKNQIVPGSLCVSHDANRLCIELTLQQGKRRFSFSLAEQPQRPEISEE